VPVFDIFVFIVDFSLASTFTKYRHNGCIKRCNRIRCCDRNVSAKSDVSKFSLFTRSHVSPYGREAPRLLSVSPGINCSKFGHQHLKILFSFTPDGIVNAELVSE
jgi:hypothetical protein